MMDGDRFYVIIEKFDVKCFRDMCDYNEIVRSVFIQIIFTRVVAHEHRGLVVVDLTVVATWLGW